MNMPMKRTIIKWDSEVIKNRKTVIQCIRFVKEVDEDKPHGEHFESFHQENRKLLKDLKFLLRTLKS